jgi:hypothetical protein
LATNQKRTPPCYGLPRLVQPSGDLGDDLTSAPAAKGPPADLASWAPLLCVGTNPAPHRTPWHLPVARLRPCPPHRGLRARCCGADAAGPVAARRERRHVPLRTRASAGGGRRWAPAAREPQPSANWLEQLSVEFSEDRAHAAEFGQCAPRVPRPAPAAFAPDGRPSAPAPDRPRTGTPG